MRKLMALLLCLVMMGASLTPLGMQAQAYATNQRSRVIHVVYDDSGSMVRDGGVFLDRWGQAKYAMEVFAAMLGENDVMRVYYMSCFDTSVGGDIHADPLVVMSGSEPARERVAKIHNTITTTANTPFDPVLKAFADLRNQTADERWLVVLTDGEFNRLYGEVNNNVDVEGYYSRFVGESDVRIIHFAMGDDAATITADPSRNIFFEHSRNDHEILGKVTYISNLIFNRNILPFSNEARHEFNFDIPMMELIVFAQGANVSIAGIVGDGSHGPVETVGVRYSEVAGENWRNNPNVIVSRNLVGVLYTFRDIPLGSYSLEITGAETVEIYYKPVVNLDIKLFQDGAEIRGDPIAAGEYQLYFGIVNEDGEFFQSSLLGLVSYTAVAANGGREIHITNGETIHLAPGELTVNVRAQFLEINTAESILRRRVSEDAPPPPPPSGLDIEITAPNDEFTRRTLNDTGAFTVTIRHEGELLTEEQWRSMDLPVVTSNANVDISEVRRGARVSTFEFNIRQRNGDPFQTARGTITLNAEARIRCYYHGGTVCEGRGSLRLAIRNDIGFWDDFMQWVGRNWGWVKWVLKALGALLLIILFWGFKKRFPRYMDKEPKILQTSGTGRGVPLEHSGSFKKATWSRICPFVAHRGTLDVVAGYDHMLPTLKVRALGGNNMVLTNTQDFLQGQLVDCTFYPDGFTPTPRVCSENIIMPCGGEVKTEFSSIGRRTVYRCHLKKSDG